MKVDSSPDSYIGSVAGGPQKATAPAAAEAGAAASAASAANKPQAGVTVTLSASTTEARSVSGGSEVFNADKVAAMKEAIANGSFQINAGAIADKMLANAAEMLGPRS